MGKSYTKKEKAVAIAVVEAHDGNIARASKELGIPERTVGHWAKGENIDQEVLDLVSEAKEEIKTKLRSVTDQMLDRASEILRQLKGVQPTYSDLQKLFVSIAIGIDKAELIEGKPTSRVETSSPNDYQANLDIVREERRKLSKVG